MSRNEREVFEYLTSAEDTSGANDFLTYAVFANELKEWIAHFVAKNNRQPSQEEIDSWIGDLTDWRFEQWRREAQGFFDTAARAYMAEEIEASMQAALESAILTEVRTAGAFWRQLTIALVTAILAPVIIGLIIAAAIVYSDYFPTIRDLASGIRPF